MRNKFQMNEQIFFDFKTNSLFDINNFFVNQTNVKAFSLISNSNFLENIILVGPRKSGKSHLANIWRNNKKALIFKNNIDEIISQNKNVLIENLFYDLDEEKIFYLIKNKLSEKKYQSDNLVTLHKLSSYYIENYDFAREINLLSKTYSSDPNRLKNIRLVIIQSLNDRKLIEKFQTILNKL